MFVPIVLATVFAAIPQERTVRHSGVVHASAEQLWQAFTTPAGIAAAWRVEQALVDLRVGGAIRTYDDLAGGIGDAGTVEHAILAFEPGRMLALRARVSEGAPQEMRDFVEQSWTVVSIEPLSARRARLSISGTTTADGEHVPGAFESLGAGNAEMLARVQEAFASAAEQADVARAWELVRSWVGGEWLAERQRPRGSERSLVRATSILGGAFVLEESWQRLLEPERAQHTRTFFGIDPETQELSFWSFDDSGALSRGSVRAVGERELHLDWSFAPPPSGHPPELLRGAAVLCAIELRAESEHVVSLHADEARRARGELLDDPWTYRRVLEGGFDELKGAASPALDASAAPGPRSGLRIEGSVRVPIAELWERLEMSAAELTQARRAAAERIDSLAARRAVGLDPLFAVSDARYDVLAHEPQRMLAFRGIAPDIAPESVRRGEHASWHVIRLEPLSDERTRFTEVGCGYADGPADRAAFQYFARIPSAAFGDASVPAPEVALARIQPFVGHTFHAEGEAMPGVSVRTRTQWSRWSPAFVLAHSHLGEVEHDAVREHGYAIYGVDPASGVPSFWRFGAGGVFAHGTLVDDGARGIGHVWRQFAPSQHPRTLYVRLTPTELGYDYRAHPSREDATQLLEFAYRRAR
jgi:uncharacterized protein YndB with AHSA1/START domain